MLWEIQGLPGVQKNQWLLEYQGMLKAAGETQASGVLRPVWGEGESRVAGEPRAAEGDGETRAARESMATGKSGNSSVS